MKKLNEQFNLIGIEPIEIIEGFDKGHIINL